MSCEYGKCQGNSTSHEICYVGKEFDILEVYTGQKLTETIENISTELEKYIKFSKVDILGLDIPCNNSLHNLPQSEATLQKIIERVYKDICNLTDLVISNSNFWYNESNYPFNLGELTPNGNKNGEIIQEILNKLNSLQNKIDTILPTITEEEEEEEENTSYIEQLIENKVITMLKNNLTSCSKSIKITGSGVNTKFNILHIAPNRTILSGAYPLSWFDSSGKGLAEYGMCGWYIADGRNGTIDMRGFGMIGATSMNTSKPLNTKAYQKPTSLGDIIGEAKQKLKLENIPPHVHKEGNNTHRHTVKVPDLTEIYLSATAVATPPRTIKVARFTHPDAGDKYANVQTSETNPSSTTGGVEYGGTIGSGSQGKPEGFDVVEPNRAIIFIQRIDNNLPNLTIPDPELGGGMTTVTVQ